MDPQPSDHVGASSFDERYELRTQHWHDGPHAGWRAFDRTLEREVLVRAPYVGGEDAGFVALAQFRASLVHPPTQNRSGPMSAQVYAGRQSVGPAQVSVQRNGPAVLNARQIVPVGQLAQ